MKLVKRVKLRLRQGLSRKSQNFSCGEENQRMILCEVCEACEARKKVVLKFKKKSLQVIKICVMLCEACEACEAKIKAGAE